VHDGVRARRALSASVRREAEQVLGFECTTYLDEMLERSSVDQAQAVAEAGYNPPSGWHPDGVGMCGARDLCRGLGRIGRAALCRRRVNSAVRGGALALALLASLARSVEALGDRSVPARRACAERAGHLPELFVTLFALHAG